MAKALRIRRPSNGKAPGLPSANSKRRIDREGPIHREIIAHLRKRFPAGIIHHSANSIGLSGALIQRQIAQNEAMGTVKGFPDLLCILPIIPVVCGFEIKAPGNYPDKDQRDLHAAMQALGVPVAVVRSVTDVDAALGAWTSSTNSDASERHNDKT